MGAWRQPYHQHTRLTIAEAGHRLAPIFNLSIGALALACHLLSPGHQARTTGALNDFIVQCLPRMINIFGYHQYSPAPTPLCPLLPRLLRPRLLRKQGRK
jgi:hypothetical protein